MTAAIRPQPRCALVPTCRGAWAAVIVACLAIGAAHAESSSIEVAAWVKQYQVMIDPDRLRAHGIPPSHVQMAIQRADQEVGASVIEMAEVEYRVRASGYLDGRDALESVPLGQGTDGVPLLPRDVATIDIGIIMPVYLDQAYTRMIAEARRLSRRPTVDELKSAVLHGAGRRVRPVIMTVATIVVGLMPIMIGTGIGSEVARTRPPRCSSIRFSSRRIPASAARLGMPGTAGARAFEAGRERRRSRRTYHPCRAARLPERELSSRRRQCGPPLPRPALPCERRIVFRQRPPPSRASVTARRAITRISMNSWRLSAPRCSCRT